MRQIELADVRAVGAPVHQEVPVHVELHHARVHIAVADEDVAVRIPGHIGGPVEVAADGPRFALVGKLDVAMVPLFPAPQVHADITIWVELDDRIGSLVYDPEVVLVIEAHLVGIGDAVHALPDLSHVVAVLVELEQLRSGIRPDWTLICTTRVIENHDVSHGIHCNTEDFAQIHVRGVLERPGKRLERNLGCGLL